MKRIIAFIMAAMMLFAFTACGGSDTETIIMEMESDGILITYQIDAKGDKIQKITQTSALDCSAYSEDQIAQFETLLTQYADVYAGIDGVTYETKVDNSTIKEIITMDVSTKENVAAIVENNLMSVESENGKTPTYVSLKMTIENMEALGFVIIE